MYGTDVTDEKPYRSINELITHIPVDFVKTFPREPIGVFVLTKLVFFFFSFLVHFLSVFYFEFSRLLNNIIVIKQLFPPFN